MYANDLLIKKRCKYAVVVMLNVVVLHVLLCTKCKCPPFRPPRRSIMLWAISKTPLTPCSIKSFIHI